MFEYKLDYGTLTPLRALTVHEDIKKEVRDLRCTLEKTQGYCIRRRRKKDKQAGLVSERSSLESIQTVVVLYETRTKAMARDRTSRLKEARRILKEEKQRREKEKLERDGKVERASYRSPNSPSRHDQDTKTNVTTLIMITTGFKDSDTHGGSALTDMSSVLDRTLDSRMSAKVRRLRVKWSQHVQS